MNTYLFTWNPKRWQWDTIESDIKQIDKNGVYHGRWSCGNSTSIQAGDRVFLIKIGTEPKGIIGAGFARTAPYPDWHWNGENRKTNYVEVDFETLLNPEKDTILSLNALMVGNLSKQSWTPQSSGISIRPQLVNELEKVWFDFLTTNKLRHDPFALNKDKSEKTYSEGTLSQVLMTKYERNPFARKVCIDHYGISCRVCDFNFEETYGEVGKDFIHVHHIRPVANIGKKYTIDPIKDLIPVCPNCHSMLHTETPPMGITDLKKKISV